MYVKQLHVHAACEAATGTVMYVHALKCCPFCVCVNCFSCSNLCPLHIVYNVQVYTCTCIMHDIVHVYVYYRDGRIEVRRDCRIQTAH